MTHPALVSYRSRAWPWILVLPFDHVIGQEKSLHSITNEMVIFSRAFIHTSFTLIYHWLLGMIILNLICCGITLIRVLQRISYKAINNKNLKNPFVMNTNM